MHDFSGLDQRQCLEQLIHGAEAAREDDEGFRVLDEHRLAHEEVVELDAEVDELVEALLERQLDVETDRQTATFTGAHVGRFHYARAAASDDGEAPPGELGRQRARGIVHRVGRTNARRTEERYSRTQGGQRIEARHELGLDAQHPPGVAFEELRGVPGPLQQLAVFDLPLHPASDDSTGAPLAGFFPHGLANSNRGRPRRRNWDSTRAPHHYVRTSGATSAPRRWPASFRPRRARRAESRLLG